MDHGLRALVVSYQFPPVGGAGVLRMRGLIKYLPLHGVEPVLLTAANPSSPVRDESLAEGLSPDLAVLRARTLEPGYGVKRVIWRSAAAAGGASTARLRRWSALAARSFAVPDAQVLWAPAAQAALARRLARGADDVVLISGPPFSQFLLAPSCRLRRGTAVVLDYRDEWSTYRRAHEMTGAPAAFAGAMLEPVLLRAAHAVTVTSEASREALLERFRFLDPAMVRTISNGYDADDFPEEESEPPPDRFRLTYAGTVFALTSARGFLAGVRRLHEREPALARLLEVRFIGRVVDTEAHAFAGTEAIGVQRIAHIDHRAAIGELRRSHATLCVLDQVPGTERIHPAKIFELMALRRRTLVLAPPGALRELVLRHHAGDVVAPRDEEAVATTLERYLRAFRDGCWSMRSEAVGIERYDRRRLAGEFARLLADAVGAARRRRASVLN